jgi:hypothetical protein
MRASTTGQLAASTSALSRSMAVKAQELEAVHALDQTSALYEQRILALCEEMEVAADASVGESILVEVCDRSLGSGIGMPTIYMSRLIYLDKIIPWADIPLTVMGRVLEQWPQMFKVLGLLREFETLCPGSQSP